MTRAKNEIERTNGPRTGGYYWFPSQAGSTVEWSVLTCHDLGFGPDEGHFDMWPSVIDRLATAWVRDVVRLRRRLAGHCYGLPRGRVTRPDRRYLLLHGHDAPSPTGWSESSSDSTSTGGPYGCYSTSTSKRLRGTAGLSMPSSGSQRADLAPKAGRPDVDRP